MFGGTRRTIAVDLRLLAEKIVELNIAASVSTMTVQRALKKTNLSLT